MKTKILLMIIFGGASFGLSSCTTGDCCDCPTTTICEEDYNDNGTGVSWEEWKDDGAPALSCNCD